MAERKGADKRSVGSLAAKSPTDETRLGEVRPTVDTLPRRFPALRRALVDGGADAALNAVKAVKAVNAAFKFWEVRPWFLARTSAESEFAERAAAFPAD